MEEIYIKTKGYSFLEKKFKDNDLVSIYDLLGYIEDLDDDNERLEEEIEDLKQNIEDNYKQIPYNEQVGVYDSDFI